ncbi:S-adenosyl-L-methionine-dependent methyltransferases superfamily protein [Artemisia annua]|uniref:S-adenosyl-L-methionine-dependent methyltransferases superfamily protein n=1 Tax=Artemisia annua TaxID=35608 RepID=A0A2U1LH77_ARTAN|nr:S-adenosyl-L-methionine-dependent methyltransferases superfamily protein [Artemisia annua]
MTDYIFGKKKATEVAHSIWKHVVKKGDAVVDATCGNGYDTLAMLNMVADESCNGRVYSLDIQESALQNTASLLDGLPDPDKKEMVKLIATCHSKMEEVIPRDVKVRLVAFNLGYLPGGDKTLITKSDTTRLAMEAASRIVASGGLISMLVYVGHAGGMEEYDTVEGFASQLSVNDWICCKLQMLNRPLAPILVLLCKRLVCWSNFVVAAIVWIVGDGLVVCVFRSVEADGVRPVTVATIARAPTFLTNFSEPRLYKMETAG